MTTNANPTPRTWDITKVGDTVSGGHTVTKIETSGAFHLRVTLSNGKTIIVWATSRSDR